MSPTTPENQSKDESDLAALLERAAQGDQRAWALIVEGWAPRVFGLLRAQCGDPELAEEIVQSTFCTIASKIESYDEVGRFESWLFRIAMNRLRDEMRRRKRHARPMEISTLVALGSSVEDSHETLDQEQVSALTAALSDLSEKDREVIDLRHMGGMSFREIAELLSEPVGTLLARHHRALQKLRELLRHDIPGPDDSNDKKPTRTRSNTKD